MAYRGKNETSQASGEQRAITTTWRSLQPFWPLSKTPITEITIEAEHVLAAEQLASNLRSTLPDNLEVRNISSQFSALLGSLQMQQRMMSIVLSLVVVVAACNLVTSLVMMVTERKKEIALMRSVGMKRRALLAIFMLQGLMLSLAALLLGTACGVLIAWHITGWVDAIEHFFQIKLISDQVFMLNYLPSQVQLLDIVWIWLGTFILALLSSLYPARLACAVEPAEVLRYE
jgi:lipoprotein-releasing system permease protein